MNPTPEIRRVIYAYMLDTASDYTDSRTGEINCTTLAEDTADHFADIYGESLLYEPDTYQPSDGITDYVAAEWIFDLAVDVEQDIIEGRLE